MRESPLLATLVGRYSRRMDTSTADSQAPGPDSPQSLGGDEFAIPSDDGLSLEELSQAYAALLAKGTDPYSESAIAESSAGAAKPMPAGTCERTGGSASESSAISPAARPSRRRECSVKRNLHRNGIRLRVGGLA